MDDRTAAAIACLQSLLTDEALKHATYEGSCYSDQMVVDAVIIADKLLAELAKTKCEHRGGITSDGRCEQCWVDLK